VRDITLKQLTILNKLDVLATINVAKGLNTQYWEIEAKITNGTSKPRELVYKERKNISSSSNESHKSMNVNPNKWNFVVSSLDFFSASTT
jgi:hypothetical protein